MKERVKRLLASPSFVYVSTVIAVLLFLPSVRAGFALDDSWHQLMVRRAHRAFGGSLGDWDIFRFQNGNSASSLRCVDVGWCPWWSAAELHASFFRPLASLSHTFDYRLFPGRPELMHLEGIAIFAATVILVGLLYRRLAGATVAAGLAVLMYAIDDAHCLDVVWIANRNAALAAALGFGVIILHDHAVRSGSRLARLLAPLLLALALLAGEAGLGTVGYLAAHALWLEGGSRGKRALSLAPYALVVLAWSIVYRALDYGAVGSAQYVDPGRAPLSFLGGLVWRLPLLLHGQFGFPPSDLWVMVPDQARPMAVTALAASVLIGAAVLAIGVRRTKENAFYATGLILALVPVCATVPSDRLLLFSGFGAFGLIADFLTAPRDQLHGARRIVVRAGGVFFVLVHLVLAPLLLTVSAAQILRLMNASVERSDESLPTDLSGKQLIIVDAPDAYSTAYAMDFRQVRGAPVPEAARLLAVVSRGTLKLRRTGERTVELSPSQGFFHDPLTKMFRDDGHPLGLGEHVRVAGMTATVQELMPDGKQPKTVAFEFDEPLEAPSFVWVAWREARFERFILPAVGAEAELPTAKL